MNGMVWMVVKGLGFAFAAAVAGYVAYAAVAWCRYGRATPPRPDEQDEHLDRVMPTYEVVERHHIRVAAPARVTLEAARDIDLLAAPVVRAIVRAREFVLRAVPDRRRHPRGLLAEMQFLGWKILADVPGREVVVGAVTRPWEANVTFRGIDAERFAAFDEPDYVKIVWTLRADAMSAGESMFRTETRVLTTDPRARARFRRYWALFSAGIIVIRWVMLAPLRKEAERRVRADALEDVAVTHVGE